MLKLFDIGIDNAVALTISGKISEEDMSLVLNSLRNKIDTYGDVVILEKIESIGRVEFSAVIEKFQYLFDYGISNIKKVAILTDKDWIEEIVDIEDSIFSKIDMKSFHLHEQDKAIEFLKS